MAAQRHRLCQNRVDDLVEAEVDVVTGDVELDRGDGSRRGVLVHVLHETRELLGREAAEGDDAVELVGAWVVIPEVRFDADVRPAEGVHPAAVDSPKGARVAPQQPRPLAHTPVGLRREVTLARLERHGSRGDRAEALERQELADRAHAVGEEPVPGLGAVTEQARRGDDAVAQPHAVQVEHRLAP